MPSSLDSPGFQPERTPRGLTSDAMGFINKKFIGAVVDEWTLYSDQASDYEIGDPIGFGASSTVYAATYHPSSNDPQNSPAPIPCALKVLDLDLLPRRSLQLLQRETTLMSLSKHPNVLRVRGSWIDGHKLYIALRLMNKGSAADVMHYGWPGGLEEEVVRCILRQALNGLNYLHVNGFIHRDIKAANLLIDDDGTVLLGDLGVAADLSEDSSSSSHPGNTAPRSGKSYVLPSTAVRQARRSVAFQSTPKIKKRKSFVGTPCWMAPELIEGRQYDFSADIWSFGITALELCQGRPPRSRESSKEVLVRIIQDASPTLDREGGTYKYSRAFKEMIDSCLVKDPSKRPTAEELLQTPFFRGAKKKGYLINTILNDLPPLTRRQERVSRHPPSVATVDSWDFATTIHSPTSTIHHRRKVVDEIPVSAPPEHQVADAKQGPVEDGRLSASSSSASSEGNISMDVVGGGQSTPPTNPSSFADSLLSPNPSLPASGGQTSSVPQSEEPVKKRFWSRLSSGVRRASVSSPVGSGTVSLVTPTAEHPDLSTQSPPQVRAKNVIVDQKDVQSGTSKDTPAKVPLTKPQKDPITTPSVMRQYLRPASAGGVLNSEPAGAPGKSEVKVGMSTTKTRRPSSSRGSLLIGMIGEAKSKLTKS